MRNKDAHKCARLKGELYSKNELFYGESIFKRISCMLRFVIFKKIISTRLELGLGLVLVLVLVLAELVVRVRVRVNSNPNPSLTLKLATRFQSFLCNLILEYPV